MHKISIVTVTDNNYTQHLGVMLKSLLINNKKNEFQIYVLYFNKQLSKYNISLIKEIFNNHPNSSIKFIKAINEGVYQKFPSKINHISKTAFLKIMMSQLLPAEIKKVLYLDCDLVVERKIMRLWQIDISKILLAAVEDPLFDKYEEIELNKNSTYFNSGVMLINLCKWRKDKISEKAIQFMTKNPDKLLNADQEALNVVASYQTKIIHPKYNLQTVMFGYTPNKLNINEEVMNIAIKKPIIVHYSTSSKPWQFANNHPLRSLYRKYLVQTPFKNFKFNDINFKSIILHFTPIKIEYLISDIIKQLKFSKVIVKPLS